MTHVVLVHGAMHGGWCFERLSPELAVRGLDPVAVDLPCDRDVGVDAYVEVVEAAVAAAGEDAVLVGHSLGGLTVARVAERRPLRHLVFLCAVVPEPGRSFEAIQAEKERFCSEGPLPTVSGPAGAAVAPVPPPEVTARLFYGDCPPELAAWAHARLRPQSTRPLSEPSAVTGPPPGPVTVITCTDDPLTPPVWQRHRATTVLGGAPVVELAGGHSPFLSRPAALAEVLAGVVSATGC